MRHLAITFVVTGFFTCLLLSCSGGKINNSNTLSQEEIQEVEALDSLSSEIENSLEEIENSEAELQKALEDIDL